MILLRSVAAVLILLAAAPALADPCGMVPPIYLDGGVPITRIGLQKSYVFHKDGLETFVIRPGFSGKVEEFGMLIPFPEPPAIRKVPDTIFGHIEAAIDPPEVVVDLTPRPTIAFAASGAVQTSSEQPEQPLGVNQVRVLRQEAVGMYEIAVLDAGSSAALKRWMDDHGYKFPDGMDAVCDDYIKSKWCFVAIKTRVGPKSSVDPKPGMRRVNPGLPQGSTFDGHVQAMGFRFHAKELVVPMRLSAFNDGELRNVVYLLTQGPRRIRSIPEEYVVRQISGEQLLANVTEPLPLRIIGGTINDINKGMRANLTRQRDPIPKNGHARELFATDLLAVSQGRLSHPHEEAEKALLNIGERLGLRGAQVDQLNLKELAADREKAVAAALADLKEMTLTVIDGDFPREVLGGQNLQFAQFEMPSRRNTATSYDAKSHGPAGVQRGVRHIGALGMAPTAKDAEKLSSRGLQGMIALALATAVIGLVLLRRR